MQLRVVFETGDKDYYWLNNVVAVGLLSNVEGGGEDSFLLKIDVWHVSCLPFSDQPVGSGSTNGLGRVGARWSEADRIVFCS